MLVLSSPFFFRGGKKEKEGGKLKKQTGKLTKKEKRDFTNWREKEKRGPGGVRGNFRRRRGKAMLLSLSPPF